MSRIYVHIGLHKTATTTLQRHVFPEWPGVHFEYRGNDFKMFVRSLVLSDPMYFDPDLWRETVDRWTETRSAVVISSESLSGALYAGVGKRGIDHRLPILTNLKTAIPDARIIILLRRQDRLARSLYRQYLKVGGTESVYGFFGGKSESSPIFPESRFRFGPYVETLKKMFPAGVFVRPFEEFVEDSNKFLQQLAQFMDLDAPAAGILKSNETRFGSLGLEISRLSNFLCRSRLNPGGILPGLPMVRNGRLQLVSISSIIHGNWPASRNAGQPGDSRIERKCGELLERAKEDNKRLDKRFELGLRRYGYY